MKSLLTYDASMRGLFDEDTQSILDALANSFPLVQIEGDNNAEDENRWFVQIRRASDPLPVGFYGSTVIEAATRLATALKVSG